MRRWLEQEDKVLFYCIKVLIVLTLELGEVLEKDLMENKHWFVGGLFSKFIELSSIKFEKVNGRMEKKMGMVMADSVGFLLISAPAEAILVAAHRSLHPPRRPPMGLVASSARSPQSVASSAFSSAGRWTSQVPWQKRLWSQRRPHLRGEESVCLDMPRKRRSRRRRAHRCQS